LFKSYVAPRDLYSFPTRRSSDLKRLGFGTKFFDMDNDGWPDISFVNGHVYDNVQDIEPGATYQQPTMLFQNNQGKFFTDVVPQLDRKSTRLNSSHSQISYAVFCL